MCAGSVIGVHWAPHADVDIGGAGSLVRAGQMWILAMRDYGRSRLFSNEVRMNGVHTQYT